MDLISFRHLNGSIDPLGRNSLMVFDVQFKLTSQDPSGCIDLGNGHLCPGQGELSVAGDGPGERHDIADPNLLCGERKG